MQILGSAMNTPILFCKKRFVTPDCTRSGRRRGNLRAAIRRFPDR
jgi:hypothetical protein